MSRYLLLMSLAAAASLALPTAADAADCTTNRWRAGSTPPGTFDVVNAYSIFHFDPSSASDTGSMTARYEVKDQTDARLTGLKASGIVTVELDLTDSVHESGSGNAWGTCDGYDGVVTIRLSDTPSPSINDYSYGPYTVGTFTGVQTGSTDEWVYTLHDSCSTSFYDDVLSGLGSGLLETEITGVMIEVTTSNDLQGYAETLWDDPTTVDEARYYCSNTGGRTLRWKE